MPRCTSTLHFDCKNSTKLPTGSHSPGVAKNCLVENCKVKIRCKKAKIEKTEANEPNWHVFPLDVRIKKHKRPPLDPCHCAGGALPMQHHEASMTIPLHHISSNRNPEALTHQVGSNARAKAPPGVSRDWRTSTSSLEHLCRVWFVLHRPEWSLERLGPTHYCSCCLTISLLVSSLRHISGRPPASCTSGRSKAMAFHSTEWPLGSWVRPETKPPWRRIDSTCMHGNRFARVVAKDHSLHNVFGMDCVLGALQRLNPWSLNSNEFRAEMLRLRAPNNCTICKR